MPGIWIYFKAKTALIEDGTLPEVKHPFDSALPYSELVREFEEASGGRGQVLKGMPIAGSTCSYTPLSRGVLWCPLAGASNARNLIPRAYIADDPFLVRPS